MDNKLLVRINIDRDGQSFEEIPELNPCAYPPLYVKRPDLRPNELQDITDKNEVALWKWWMDSNEVAGEVSGPDGKNPLMIALEAATIPVEELVLGKRV